jgi:hypothetical protein
MMKHPSATFRATPHDLIAWTDIVIAATTPTGTAAALRVASGRTGLRNPRPPSDKPQGRFTRPDQCRRAYKPGVQCDACKRIGYNAVNCDMLAIALYIDRYIKDISATERSTIESCWLDKYRSKLG